LLRLWCWFLVLALNCSLAQDLPPGGRVAEALPVGPELQRVLETARPYLEGLRPVALYQPRHDTERGRARYAVQVLLGDEHGPFVRLALHPRGLQPLPLGLESRVPPLPPRRAPSSVARMVQDDVLGRLLFATLVLEEPEGYRLLLVHSGRVVGEMRLDDALRPRPYPGWEAAYEASPWRYP
jgi:hypothetical protein